VSFFRLKKKKNSTFYIIFKNQIVNIQPLLPADWPAVYQDKVE